MILKKGKVENIFATRIDTSEEYFNLEKTIKNKSVILNKSNLIGPWSIENKKNINLLNKLKNLKNKLNLNKKKFRYGIKTGLNATFFKHFFIRSEYKLGFINMPDVRTSPDPSDKASQHFTFTQLNFNIGVAFKLTK